MAFSNPARAKDLPDGGFAFSSSIDGLSDIPLPGDYVPPVSSNSSNCTLYTAANQPEEGHLSDLPPNNFSDFGDHSERINAPHNETSYQDVRRLSSQSDNSDARQSFLDLDQQFLEEVYRQRETDEGWDSYFDLLNEMIENEKSKGMPQSQTGFTYVPKKAQDYYGLDSFDVINHSTQSKTPLSSMDYGLGKVQSSKDSHSPSVNSEEGLYFSNGKCYVGKPSPENKPSGKAQNPSMDKSEEDFYRNLRYYFAGGKVKSRRVTKEQEEKLSKRPSPGERMGGVAKEQEGNLSKRPSLGESTTSPEESSSGVKKPPSVSDNNGEQSFGIRAAEKQCNTSRKSPSESNSSPSLDALNADSTQRIPKEQFPRKSTTNTQCNGFASNHDRVNNSQSPSEQPLNQANGSEPRKQKKQFPMERTTNIQPNGSGDNHDREDKFQSPHYQEHGTQTNSWAFPGGVLGGNNCEDSGIGFTNSPSSSEGSPSPVRQEGASQGARNGKDTSKQKHDLASDKRLPHTIKNLSWAERQKKKKSARQPPQARPKVEPKIADCAGNNLDNKDDDDDYVRPDPSSVTSSSKSKKMPTSIGMKELLDLASQSGKEVCCKIGKGVIWVLYYILVLVVLLMLFIVASSYQLGQTIYFKTRDFIQSLPLADSAREKIWYWRSRTMHFYLLAKSALVKRLKKEPKTYNLPSTGNDAILQMLSRRHGDPYSILGVPPEASDDDIKRQYRKLAVLIHPDKNADPQAAEAFKILASAFEVIGDTEKRREFDTKHAKSDLNSQRDKTYASPAEMFADLNKKMKEMRESLGCEACGGRHPRVPTNRTLYNARFCAECNTRHPAREGDIWLEATYLGVVNTFYACMDNKVYDVTKWATCQGFQIPANTHRSPARLHTQAQHHTPPHQSRSEGDLLDDLLRDLYSKYRDHNSDSSRGPRKQQRQRRRKKR
ncbi:uncharacterized protein LOC116614780 [Nematostella vectensis]|uniref:uncharacterized protein LOC116614780 n=1 Tax=Nematostella vectensis TaxID=45351 RepID=UPI002076DD97|nr:uncharacterized protein LOC116614780 [Nematostella vectensis]XP_032232073.2 uncharacterized protein LOC116614780 [Nematostella vectensis]